MAMRLDGLRKRSPRAILALAIAAATAAFVAAAAPAKADGGRGGPHWQQRGHDHGYRRDGYHPSHRAPARWHRGPRVYYAPPPRVYYAPPPPPPVYYAPAPRVYYAPAPSFSFGIDIPLR